MNASRLAAGAFFLLAWLVIFEDLILPRSLLVSAGYDSFLTILSISIIFLWFILDSKERGVVTSPLLKAMVILLPFIAIPYYKVKNFGWLHGLQFGGIFLAMLILPPIIVAWALGMGIKI